MKEETKIVIWGDIIYPILKKTVFSLSFWLELLDDIVSVGARLIMGFGILILMYQHSEQTQYDELLFYTMMLWSLLPIFRKVRNYFKYRYKYNE